MKRKWQEKICSTQKKSVYTHNINEEITEEMMIIVCVRIRQARSVEKRVFYPLGMTKL